MVGIQPHIRAFPACWFLIVTDIVFRFTQIHYWLRCTFPVWRHWTARLTRKGQVLRGVRKTLQGSVILGLLAAFGFLRQNPEQKAQLVQSLLAGKEWLVSAIRQLTR